MEASYVNHMGDDLMVVNAARVSFHKESEWLREQPEFSFSRPRKTLSERDQKLLRYLAEHSHWSPFAHPQVTFRVKAPIFVARQLVKHQVGLVWNEVSRRYVDSKPEFFEPEAWRKKAENKKQGSSDETFGDSTHEELGRQLVIAEGACFAAYQNMLDYGVCPEQARMVLPQSMYTEWYWTGSLYAWARVCRQRLDSHAQAETREIAEEIGAHMAALFPYSWAALRSEKS